MIGENKKEFICEDCEIKEAEVHCVECGQYLCNDCDPNIHNKGKRRCHEREKISNLILETTNKSFSSSSFRKTKYCIIIDILDTSTTGAEIWLRELLLMDYFLLIICENQDYFKQIWGNYLLRASSLLIMEVINEDKISLFKQLKQCLSLVKEKFNEIRLISDNSNTFTSIFGEILKENIWCFENNTKIMYSMMVNNDQSLENIRFESFKQKNDNSSLAFTYHTPSFMIIDKKNDFFNFENKKSSLFL